MRYRIGTEPDPAGYAPDQTVFGAIAWVGVAMGIGFVVAGWRGRQSWMVIWGAMLTVSSAVYSTTFA